MLEKSGLGKFYKTLRRRNPSSGSIEDYRREDFCTLPYNTLELLHRNYEEDFLLFGYDATPFFDICLKRRKKDKSRWKLVLLICIFDNDVGCHKVSENTNTEKEFLLELCQLLKIVIVNANYMRLQKSNYNRNHLYL